MPQVKTETLAKRSLYAYRHLTLRADKASTMQLPSATLPLSKNARCLRVWVMLCALLQIATHNTHIFNLPAQILQLMGASRIEATGQKLVWCRQILTSLPHGCFHWRVSSWHGIYGGQRAPSLSQSIEAIVESQHASAGTVEVESSGL
jgi:hypothetical protein